MTSHPNDMSDSLIDAHATNKKANAIFTFTYSIRVRFYFKKNE